MSLRTMGVVGLGVVMLVGGCATAPSASPGGSASGGVSPAASAGGGATAPAEALARMRKSLAEARAGSYTERVVTDVGDGSTLTRVARGRFDLVQRRWTARISFEAEPASAAQRWPGLVDKSMDIVVVESDVYLTVPSWPAALRGRWLRLDDSALPGGVDMGGQSRPLPVLALDRLVPDTASPGAQGRLTGHLSLADAIALLGLKAGAVKSGVDLEALDGLGRAELELDDQGLPMTLSLSGREVRPDSALPASVRDALPLQSSMVTFERWGDQGDIEAPGADRLIDPSEMKP